MTTSIAGTTDPRILEARRRAKERRRRVPGTFYALALPALVLFFVLHTVPVIQGFFYSFTDYAGYGTWKWVGLKNYSNLLQDDRIRHSYWFTIKFAVAATILVNIVSLAIAVGLNAAIKARTAFRGIFFMPHVMSILIVGYVFNFMFANSLPWFGDKLGITKLSSNILADPDLLDRVARFAAKGRTTRTAVITAALEAYLAAHDESPALPFLAVGRSQHGRLSLDGRSIVRREAGRRPPSR